MSGRGLGPSSAPELPRPSSNAASGSAQGREGKERSWRCSRKVTAVEELMLSASLAEKAEAL